MTRPLRPGTLGLRTAGAALRASGVAALCLGLGLGLAACASPDESPGGSSPEPTATEGAAMTPTPSPTSGRPQQLAGEMSLNPGESGRGLPDGIPGTGDAPAGAAWTTEPGLLYVVTYGSSSCPVLAEGEATTSGAGVEVTLNPPPADAVCTMDWAPTTTVVAVPEGTDESAPLSVSLGDQGSVEVPPRPAEGQQGEVAWATATG